jgi:hypothetical protein
VTTEEPITTGEPIDNEAITYSVEVEEKRYIVRAKSRKQAIGFIARQESQRVRDLAIARVATFEDGVLAERLGIQALDATGAEEDPNQLALGV